MKKALGILVLGLLFCSNSFADYHFNLPKDVASGNRYFKSFISVFLILFIFSPFAYYYVSITQTDKRTDYPGKEIAALVQKEWNKVNDLKPIVYVGPDEWHAGNLSYHLKDRPIVVMDNSLIYKNNFIEIDEFSENYICKYSQNKITVNTKEYLICFK